jgi:hypothetical protein
MNPNATHADPLFLGVFKDVDFNLDLEEHRAFGGHSLSPLASPRMNMGFLGALAQARLAHASESSTDSEVSSSRSVSRSPSPESSGNVSTCSVTPFENLTAMTAKPENKKRRRAPSLVRDSLDSDESGDADSVATRGLSKRERNKISASKYRKKRKLHVETLEKKLATTQSLMEDQKQAISNLQQTNKSLQKELAHLRKLVKSSTAQQQSPSAAHPVPPSQSSWSFQFPNFFPNQGSCEPIKDDSMFNMGRSGMFMFAFFGCLLMMSPIADDAVIKDSAAMEMRRPGRSLLSGKGTRSHWEPANYQASYASYMAHLSTTTSSVSELDSLLLNANMSLSLDGQITSDLFTAI